MCNTEGFWILTCDTASESFHGELHLEGTARDSGHWSHCTHIINERLVSSMTHRLAAGNRFS